MANSKSNVSEKNCFDIPVWRRYTLTIEEAAGYYHIGEGKLRMLIDQNPHEDFYRPCRHIRIVFINPGCRRDRTLLPVNGAKAYDTP